MIMFNSLFSPASREYSVFRGKRPNLQRSTCNVQPWNSAFRPATAGHSAIAANLQPSTCKLRLPLLGGEGRGLSRFAADEGELPNLHLSTCNLQLKRAAFTLIELLVVIAIIALLAALVMPITGAVNKAKIRKKTTAEMEQLVTAIENYKAQMHVYPPDNPGNTKFINQLYYELSGTSVANGIYTTLDSSSTIDSTTFGAAFGPNVTGFINASKAGGNGDEGVTAKKYIKDLKAPQIAEVGGAKILVASVGWTGDATLAPISGTTLNPWRYNSSNPTNNPGTYDLWVDVMVAGKINRICNWSKEPLIQ
jgi:prepilin-type N-terminal cleavage/methylation domain-containing protein